MALTTNDTAKLLGLKKRIENMTAANKLRLCAELLEQGGEANFAIVEPKPMSESNSPSPAQAPRPRIKNEEEKDFTRMDGSKVSCEALATASGAVRNVSAGVAACRVLSD